MSELKIVKIKPHFHKEKEVVQVHFERDEELTRLLRSNTQLRWSQTMRCWYLPYSGKVVSDLYNLLKGKAYLNYDEFKPKEEQEIITEKKEAHNTLAVLLPEVEQKIEEFKFWMRARRYSQSTINTYTDALRVFLRFYSKKQISQIDNTDLILFNNKYILANKLSASYQNQVINAIKLFFKIMEYKKLEVQLIHRPKRSSALPNVLSKEEVRAILSALSNMKHKAMLSLIYSCGLRRSELLNLKLTDIDSDRGLLIIRQAKGKKDRIAPLSQKTIVLLRDYFVAYKPKNWLFEGQNGIEKYDESSLAAVLKQAVEKAGIKKPVTLHWLRHSYATHLLENGTDLRYIQEILGHSRSRTTEIYTHVSNKSIQKVVTPFDSLWQIG